MNAYMARGVSRAKCVWAHRYSEPTIGIGERTRPVTSDAEGLSPSTLYTRYFPLIFSVRD